MKLLRLPAAKVQLGVPLPWSVRDAQGLLLLSRGHLVYNQSQLEALLQRGAFVELEEARAAEQARAAQKALVSDDAAGSPRRGNSLFNTWDRLPQRLQLLLDEAHSDPDGLSRIQGFATDLARLVDLDADIALYHTVRQESVDLYFYGYNHAIQTAVLCLLMARRLEWPASRVDSLVCAALTMNVPILALQGALARQDEPVRESQKALIRQHPQEAVRWLEGIGVSDPEWLSAVAEHHERSDGSGYPRGLHTIHETALALRVTDVFMAKISRRAFRPALAVKEAAKQLYSEDHGGSLSSALIKEFGIYPPGEVVKLASGEIGVVMRRSASAKSPLVAAITDSAGRLVVHTAHRDTATPGYAVLGNVRPPDFVARLAPERIYGFVPAPD